MESRQSAWALVKKRTRAGQTCAGVPWKEDAATWHFVDSDPFNLNVGSSISRSPKEQLPY